MLVRLSDIDTDKSKHLSITCCASIILELVHLIVHQVVDLRIRTSG
jgi:hypothetical protein